MCNYTFNYTLVKQLLFTRQNIECTCKIGTVLGNETPVGKNTIGSSGRWGKYTLRSVGS